MTTTEAPQVAASEPNAEGYKQFTLGGFTFWRDEFFVHITWPTGSHILSVDNFLRALQRDVAWDFFYGTVNFDGVFGTVNHYGTVDMFAGRYNDAYRKAELDHVENFETPLIRETFKAMLADWTNEGFDPFASPAETDKPFGVKHGDNDAAVGGWCRARVAGLDVAPVARHAFACDALPPHPSRPLVDRVDHPAMNGTIVGLGSFSCNITGVNATLTQVDNTFSGQINGDWSMTCIAGGQTETMTATGGVISNGVISGYRVSFSMATDDASQTGTISGNSMSGQATWRVDFGAPYGIVVVRGNWGAVRTQATTAAGLQLPAAKAGRLAGTMAAAITGS